MCKPISFLVFGKDARFFDFGLRQKAVTEGLKAGVNGIGPDHLDSHAAIAAFFNVNEDECDKYEYDYVADVVEVDQLNAKGTHLSDMALQNFASAELRPLVKRLVAEGTDDLLWKVLPHVLSDKSARRLAVFSAEAVLPIFEAKYPTDLRPRKAIEAAKRVIEDDTAENRKEAYAANAAANAANAYAAADTARAAAYAAAYAAANAAYAAANAAYVAAAYVAANAAYAAANAADAAYDDAAYDDANRDRKAMMSKIVAEGKRLFNEENGK
jgi:hypothetical protein